MSLILAFALFAACGRSSNANVDEQLRADLAAAASSTSQRQQFVSPQELGYGQSHVPGNPATYGAYGYGASQYGATQGAYPQPYPEQARRQQSQPTRVVYRTRSAGAGGPSSGGSSSGVGGNGEVRREEQRNTQKGAIIGAAAGAAIGVATARDKVKGGAIGALGGAVLGGVIGHQVRTQKN